MYMCMYVYACMFSRMQRFLHGCSFMIFTPHLDSPFNANQGICCIRKSDSRSLPAIQILGILLIAGFHRFLAHMSRCYVGDTRLEAAVQQMQKQGVDVDVRPLQHALVIPVVV